MVAYNGLQQVSSSTLFSAMSSVLEGDCEAVVLNYKVAESINLEPLDAEMLICTEQQSGSLSYYYKMIGKDSGLPGTNYISWVVKDAPDYTGEFAPTTIGALVDIYVSSIKEG